MSGACFIEASTAWPHFRFTRGLRPDVQDCRRRSDRGVNGTIKIPGSGKVKFPTLPFGFSGGLCGASIFGWASTAPVLDGRRRRNHGVGPDVLGQQIGLPTQAVTRNVNRVLHGRQEGGEAESVRPRYSNSERYPS